MTALASGRATLVSASPVLITRLTRSRRRSSTLCTDDRPWSSFENELQNEYAKIREDIAVLQCELVPLRARRLELQNALLARPKSTIEDDEAAVDFPSAMIQFQAESGSLKRQLREIRDLHSLNSLRVLQTELSEGENDCAVLAQSLNRIEKDLQGVADGIENLKLSKTYQDVQRQKRRIVRLSGEVDRAMQCHSELKTEHFLLDGREGKGDDLSQLDKLFHKLMYVRRRHCDKCEELIRLRTRQMKEVKDLAQEMGTVGDGPAMAAGEQTASSVLLEMLQKKITELQILDSDGMELGGPLTMSLDLLA
jgi:hypothetical protein